MGSILLVEPDPETRARLSAALGAAKHEVIEAQMTEVVQRLGEGGIDVVVIDAYDPKVGVVELAKAMDALPDTPPIVLVSGSPSAPEISARIGATAFLPKPFEPAELVGIVSRICGHPVRPVRKDRVEDPTDDEPTALRSNTRERSPHS